MKKIVWKIYKELRLIKLEKFNWNRQKYNLRN